MAAREFCLYDTKTRKVQPLKLSEEGHLRFYSCGPTVYSYAHIGNFRTFLTADLILRTAESLGWKVSYVSNITDVGHLTADDVADASGEDKMEKALKSKDGEAFKNVWDLAAHYAQAFKEDWDRLNLRRPLVWPKATEHMREQILAIQSLIDDGHAYETENGVYFDVSSFERYGELSGNRDQGNLKVAVRDVVTDETKRHPADFALWKKDDKHLMQWFSPWGWGFPGWHIECSVMAMQYLGETLDLHAGGEDLVFPHHECEIAQSECLSGKTFANHWVHTKFLQVNGEKMSKSLGNWYTARDLVDGQGVDPLALRYALISVPYSKPSNFTNQLLRDAGKIIDRYRECAELVEKTLAKAADGPDVVGAELTALADKALDAMCEDLNTSVALAHAYEGTGVIFRAGGGMSKASAAACQEYLKRIDALLGIVPNVSVVAARPSSGVDAAEIESLIQKRAEAKAGKDFATADAVRAQLLEMGIELRDTPEGASWSRRASV